MKILFIDTESFSSHANFNRIHINALLQIGCVVDGAFKVGYSTLLDIPEMKVMYEIPEKHYEHGKETQIYGRYLMLLRLWDVKKNIDFHRYDAIILSYYDETVLPFAFYPKGLYLINHINLGGLHYWIKRKLYLWLSKRNTQIVLSKDCFEYVSNLGVKNCRLVYHGLPAPYNPQMYKPLWMNKKHCIFSPSAQSSDMDAIKELVHSERFNAFLERNDVLFVVRSKESIEAGPYIKVIDSYMSNEDYQGCFVHSDAILVSYKKRFRYRVSAVLLECVANKKHVLIKQHIGLKEYEEIFGSEIFYGSVEEAISIAKRIISDTSQKEYSIDYEPDYKFLIK